FNDENLFFGNRGDGTPAIVAGGHDDDFAMQVTGRTSSWNGAQVDLTDYNLAGRTISISYWAKTEEATEVNVTLQEEFSDGSDTAYNRVASSGDITPGEWVQVTGTIEVGANTAKPILYFESPSDTASFMVDEVVISFSGAGSAPAAGNGQTLSFTFADGNVFFTPFGSGTPAIVSGGHDDDFAMQVTGRTAGWNGAAADLASYNAMGKTVSISYYVKTEEAIEVNVTLNGEQGGEATYNRLASSGEVAPGEWVQVTGSVEVPADYTKCVIYFESPSETANFTIDEVVITIE
ncbi:MAG: carbohydrate binding domain-containing protein, partial [Lachnospiraceae bacterium]|nr:carbohydrate binding domain-containing protein [Lachnospiraceae bacterium]